MCYSQGELFFPVFLNFTWLQASFIIAFFILKEWIGKLRKKSDYPKKHIWEHEKTLENTKLWKILLFFFIPVPVIQDLHKH